MCKATVVYTADGYRVEKRKKYFTLILPFVGGFLVDEQWSVQETGEFRELSQRDNGSFRLQFEHVVITVPWNQTEVECLFHDEKEALKACAERNRKK